MSEPSAPLPELAAPKGIGELLFHGFVKSRGSLGGAIGVIAAIVIVGWVSPDGVMPRWVASLIGFVLLWLLLACLSAFMASLSDAKEIHRQALQERERFKLERAERFKEQGNYEKLRAAPVVEAAIRAQGPYRTAKCVFIVRGESWLTTVPVGTPVTISVAESSHDRPHERHLGGGSVRPPQTDGRSVVTLDIMYDDADELVGALLDESKHKDIVAKVRIGPAYDLQNRALPQPSATVSTAAEVVTSADPAMSSKREAR